jgi:hypothetical protein
VRNDDGFSPFFTQRASRLVTFAEIWSTSLGNFHKGFWGTTKAARFLAEMAILVEVAKWYSNVPACLPLRIWSV